MNRGIVCRKVRALLVAGWSTWLALPVLAVGQSGEAKPSLQPRAKTQVEAPSLEQRLQPLIDRHKGKVAVGVKNLHTGVAYYYNAQEVMPTASLIKVAVAVEALRRKHEGTLDFARTVVLKESDKVPGSGLIATHFSAGAAFPIRDLLHLMMAVSDNTATNLLLDQIGVQQTCDTMAKLGLPNTRINAKVFRGSTTSIDKGRTDKYGLGSTTAAEMITLLEKVHAGEVVNVGACVELLSLMRKNDDKHQFSRFLPKGVDLAYKDGAVNKSRTAAGIIFTKYGPIALCVLSNENQDQRWVIDNAGNRLAAEIAREVYFYFVPAEKQPL